MNEKWGLGPDFELSSTQGLSQNFIKGQALFEIETYTLVSISTYFTHFKGCMGLYVCSEHSTTFLYLYHYIFILHERAKHVMFCNN
mgnify:FL=1